MKAPNASTLVVYTIILVISGIIFNSLAGNDEKTDNVPTSAENQKKIIFNRASFSQPQLSKKKYPKKILVDTENSTQELVAVVDIAFCESNDKDVLLYKEDGNQILVKRTGLITIKQKLEAAPFFYSNLKSYIINLEHVDKIIIDQSYNQSNKKYIIQMSNDELIALPKDKKNSFMNSLQAYYNY